MELCVMIIDNDNMFNLMASVLLRNTGITNTPVICTDGEEALSILQQHYREDRAFLLFLDINMPQMDGWQVLDVLNEFAHNQNIHVVMVTSSIDRVDSEKAQTYRQVIDYMIKPIKRDKLHALKASKPLAPFFAN